MKKTPKTKPNIKNFKAPEGYQELVGSRAPIWEPEAPGECISGVVTEDRIVKTQKGKKKIESRLIVINDPDLGPHGVWVSAALEQIIGQEKNVKGRQFMIVFQGMVPMKGRNPMKGFRLFEKKTSPRR